MEAADFESEELVVAEAVGLTFKGFYFVIESFSDRHYRMLVTVPEVNVTKSQQNIWNVEIWIAEELFDYLHPFIFYDLFETKLSSHQFQVLFEVIKVYCSNDTRKEFKIQPFLKSYPSKLSGEQKKTNQEVFYFLSTNLESTRQTYR